MFGNVALGISGVTATVIGVSASASCAIVVPLSGLILLSQWMANWKEVKLKELAFEERKATLLSKYQKELTAQPNQSPPRKK